MSRTTWTNRLWLAAVLAVSVSAAAQAQPPVVPPASPPTTPSTVADPAVTGAAPDSASASGPQGAIFDDQDPAQLNPKPGPTPVQDVKLLMNALGMGKDSPFIIYGWADGGYTYASTGSGLLNVEPRENRFGNQFLANQLAIAIERPLSRTDWDFGFKAIYYAGADAALLHPLGGFKVNSDKWGHDFRDLYVSMHAPVLFEEGIDVKIGRTTTPIGYTGALAPFRTFYSNDYQWFYAQDGAWTGILTTSHVTKQLDVLAGVTMGANTFFRTRAPGSYCGIGQINYWLTEEKKTMLTFSTHCGRQAIFPARLPDADGNDVTFEARVFHTWNESFDQVVQYQCGWRDTNGVETGEFYALYTIGMFHLNRCWDLNARAEWFNDVSGLRTGIKNNYYEGTVGLNYHPVSYLEIRPEMRYDYASDSPAFGTPGNSLRRGQFTAAIECLFKF